MEIVKLILVMVFFFVQGCLNVQEVKENLIVDEIILNNTIKECDLNNYYFKDGLVFINYKVGFPSQNLYNDRLFQENNVIKVHNKCVEEIDTGFFDCYYAFHTTMEKEFGPKPGREIVYVNNTEITGNYENSFNVYCKDKKAVYYEYTDRYVEGFGEIGDPKRETIIREIGWK